jgi:hypothetical protein
MGAMVLGYLQTQNSAGECGMPHFVSYDRVIPSNQLPLENVLNDQTLTGHKNILVLVLVPTIKVSESVSDSSLRAKGIRHPSV